MAKRNPARSPSQRRLFGMALAIKRARGVKRRRLISRLRAPRSKVLRIVALPTKTIRKYARKARRNPHPGGRLKKLRSYHPYLPLTRHPTRAAGHPWGYDFKLKKLLPGFPRTWLSAVGRARYVRKRPIVPKRKSRRNPPAHRMAENSHRCRRNPVLSVIGLPAHLALGNPWLETIGTGVATGFGAAVGTAAASRFINGRKRRRSNPPRPRSRASSGQRILGAKILPWSKARRCPGYAGALRAYRRFHGAAPAHATRIRIADGSSKTTRRAVFVVGEAPSIEYQTLSQRRSNKAGKGRKKIIWHHKMGEGGGRRPLIVHDPRSGVTSFVGGTYRVNNWFRR